jgi:hypothetical protein
MANNDLAPRDHLASFVRACVGDHAVEQWLAARRRIAVGSETSLSEQVEEWLTGSASVAAELEQTESVAQWAYARAGVAQAVEKRVR